MSSERTLRMMQKSEFVNDRPEEIIKALKDLIDEGIIKQKDLEKFSGFSSTSISQVLNNKYEADPEKIQARFISFYRNWIAKNTVVPTLTVDQVEQWMETAWKKKWIIRLNGRFGGGKTKAAQLYCAKHDYSVFISIVKNESIVSILHKIGDAIGIQSMVGSVQDKMKSIIRELKRKSGKLLVIDEADELNKNTLSVLRYLWDENDDYCAMVLLTTPRFDQLLSHPDLGYLQSRIAITKNIPEFSEDEVKKIVNKWNHKISAEMMKQIYSWVMANFSGRSLYFLMSCAQNEANMDDKKKIDDECVEIALTYQSTRGIK